MGPNLLCHIGGLQADNQCWNSQAFLLEGGRGRSETRRYYDTAGMKSHDCRSHGHDDGGRDLAAALLRRRAFLGGCAPAAQSPTPDRRDGGLPEEEPRNARQLHRLSGGGFMECRPAHDHGSDAEQTK